MYFTPHLEFPTDNQFTISTLVRERYSHADFSSTCIRYGPNWARLGFCTDVYFFITIIKMECADNGSLITLAGTGSDLKSWHSQQSWDSRHASVVIVQLLSTNNLLLMTHLPVFGNLQNDHKAKLLCYVSRYYYGLLKLYHRSKSQKVGKWGAGGGLRSPSVSS